MAERSTEEQARIDALIEANVERVRIMAWKLFRRLSREFNDWDSLISAGNLGLVRAAQRFEPSRGFQFSSVAIPYINGAMLDYLRTLSLLSSRERLRSERPSRKVVSIDEARGARGASRDHRDVENRVAVEELLGRIDPEEAGLIRALFLEETTNREHARRTGIDETEVCRRKARAIESLRIAAAA